MNANKIKSLLTRLVGLPCAVLFLLLPPLPVQADWYEWDYGTQTAIDGTWGTHSDTTRTGYWVLQGENDFSYSGNYGFQGPLTIENATFTDFYSLTENWASSKGFQPKTSLTINEGGTLQTVRLVTGGNASVVTINKGGTLLTMPGSSGNYLGDNTKSIVNVNGGTLYLNSNAYLAQHSVGEYSVTNGGRIDKSPDKSNLVYLGGTNDNKATYSRCNMYLGGASDASNTGALNASNIYVGNYNPGALTVSNGTITSPTLNIGTGNVRYASDGSTVATRGNGYAALFKGTIDVTNLLIGSGSANASYLNLSDSDGTVTASKITIAQSGSLNFNVTDYGTGKLVLKENGTIANSGSAQVTVGYKAALFSGAPITVYQGSEAGATALNLTSASDLWAVNAYDSATSSQTIQLTGDFKGTVVMNSGVQSVTSSPNGWANLTQTGTDPLYLDLSVSSADVNYSAADFVTWLNTIYENPIHEQWLEDYKNAGTTYKFNASEAHLGDLTSGAQRLDDGETIRLTFDENLIPGSGLFSWDFSGFTVNGESVSVSLNGISGQTVPEPSAIILLVLGFLGLTGLRRAGRGAKNE